MVSTGTYYRDMYAKWIEYLTTKKPISSFFVGSSQNDKELKTQFQSLNDVSKFTDWLEAKANSEAQGASTCAIQFVLVGDSGKTRL